MTRRGQLAVSGRAPASISERSASKRSKNFSDGTTQAVTTGAWGSEQTTIATVDGSTGRVTVVSSGDATIFVNFEGVRGTKLIAVRPNYQGNWLGS